MELRIVDPRKLKANPNNPRQTKPGAFFDAQMTASIKAIGLISPPLVKEEGKKLIILAGHRRVAGCIAAELTAIPILVVPEADMTLDPMRSVSENVVRAEMGKVDRWRAMEALAAAGWNEAAIADALGMSPRNIAQARLLANICPAMLDQMAKNDEPDLKQLRIIAAASREEQTEVWKKFKPKRGNEATWWQIAQALNKTRMEAKAAKFGDEEAKAFGIVWDEDLFVPANEDGRSTTQVDAFMAAQTAWLEANLAEGDCIVQLDQHHRPQLPKGAEERYGLTAEGVSTAYYLDPRTGGVRSTRFTLRSKQGDNRQGETDDVQPVRKSRPDVSAKGVAMVGDLRTDALHQALRERLIDDDQLIAMLVLALAGNNVTILSGVSGRFRGNSLGRLAETLTEGGALTRDLAAIRDAARGALVEVLSCRANHTASGMGARYAAAAIDADAFLPNMATDEFLSTLSRTALERYATEHGVTAQARVRDTRAAVVARFAEATFVPPVARFAPTETELEARRNPASILRENGMTESDEEPENDLPDAMHDTSEAEDSDDPQGAAFMSEAVEILQAAE